MELNKRKVYYEYIIKRTDQLMGLTLSELTQVQNNT